jgi:hypothetical protein
LEELLKLVNQAPFGITLAHDISLGGLEIGITHHALDVPKATASIIAPPGPQVRRCGGRYGWLTR